MRSEYQLKKGRPNPYLTKLGAKGRSEMVRWWTSVASKVRASPADVVAELPDGSCAGGSNDYRMDFL